MKLFYLLKNMDIGILIRLMLMEMNKVLLGQFKILILIEKNFLLLPNFRHRLKVMKGLSIILTDL